MQLSHAWNMAVIHSPVDNLIETSIMLLTYLNLWYESPPQPFDGKETGDCTSGALVSETTAVHDTLEYNLQEGDHTGLPRPGILSFLSPPTSPEPNPVPSTQPVFINICWRHEWKRWTFERRIRVSHLANLIPNFILPFTLCTRVALPTLYRKRTPKS